MYPNSAILNLERAIVDVVQGRYPSICNNRKALSSAVRQLSEIFTKSRDDFHVDYLADERLRAAYLLHFTLTNFAKACHCMGQIQGVASDGPLKILDLGCGSGAASLAAVALFPDTPLEITALDRNGEILKDLRAIFSRIASKHHMIRTIHSEFRSRSLMAALGRSKFDIVFAMNLLNELRDGEDHRTAVRLCDDHIVEGGHLVVVDPALRSSSRSLMKTRDILIEKNKGVAISPCLNQAACPMLAANDRDWCHFYLEWTRPSIIEEMDALAGTDHKYLKTSYVVFKLHGPDRPDAARGKGLHRVVSSPLISKGKVELFLCGDDGLLRRCTRLDRDKSESNHDIDRVKRGDTVSCEYIDRITRSSEFRITSSF